VSSDARRELVERGAKPENVSVILNGIDHTMFCRDRSREHQVRQELGFRASDFVIGAVGRVEPQKRFDLLLDAFASLLKAQPQLKLVIVGDGSLLGELRAQVEHLMIHDACRLIGNRTDVADLHHAFDLFVQSSDYEGTSNAVLEAMAFETPIVATDAGGTAEIVRHGIDGLIVARGGSGVLAEAIAASISDSAAARTRANSARRRVETDLSFEARMSAVEAIYVELFQRRSGADTPRLVAARP